VPSHFPTGRLTACPIFRRAPNLSAWPDPKKGYHPDWNCSFFNPGASDPGPFLISSALFWLK